MQLFCVQVISQLAEEEFLKTYKNCCITLPRGAYIPRSNNRKSYITPHPQFMIQILSAGRGHCNNYLLYINVWAQVAQGGHLYLANIIQGVIFCGKWICLKLVETGQCLFPSPYCFRGLNYVCNFYQAYIFNLLFRYDIDLIIINILT